MKCLGFVMLVAACGEVKDPNKLADAPLTPDGPADADIDAPDVDARPPRCDPNKRFGTPVAVTELNSPTPNNDYAPSLSPDELTITFGSTRPGGPGSIDAYIATRASTSAPWGAPALIAGVNTTGQDSRPIMSGDQLTMYFEYNPVTSGGSFAIVSTTRASTSSAFTAPTAISSLDLPNSDTAPYVLPDHSALYMVNTRMLHRATRSGTTWSAPTVVTGTNLQSGDFDYPIATPDELVIYFATTRGPNQGGFDIWMATRASTVVGFDMPEPVAELTTNQPEVPGWVSADNCVMYFARNVGVAASNYEIYRAEKPL